MYTGGIREASGGRGQARGSRRPSAPCALRLGVGSLVPELHMPGLGCCWQDPGLRGVSSGPPPFLLGALSEEAGPQLHPEGPAGVCQVDRPGEEQVRGQEELGFPLGDCEGPGGPCSQLGGPWRGAQVARRCG